MQHSETYFEGLNDVRLYSQSWLPEGEPRVVLALVHGVGEYCGRYMNIVNPMVASQHGVYGYDLRGHGNSAGPRGHIDSWDDYRGDLSNFLKMIREQQADIPIFLMGHSLGALIALDFILSNSEGLAGAIISASPIEPVGLAKPYLVAIARALSRIYPRFSMSLQLEQEALSRDPSVVEAYREDPLVHPLVSARWGTESLDVRESVKQNVESIDIPILMIHGENDRINSSEGTRRYYEQIKVEDKELLIFPDRYHEPHNDLGNEEVARKIVDWVNRHVEQQ